MHLHASPEYGSTYSRGLDTRPNTHLLRTPRLGDRRGATRRAQRTTRTEREHNT